MTERWCPVRGFEGLYEVSSFGVVRALPRQGTKGGPLVAQPGVRGHLKVVLYAGRGRRAAPRWVHSLVLEAFVGPRPAGLIACHADGNPANNTPQNLRWDTHLANSADARRHGTVLTGFCNPATKIGPEGKRAIREMRATGATQKTIARAIGVCQQHVSAILGETTR